MGLKTKFIIAFVGFTVLFAVIFGGIAAYRMAYELDEQFVERAQGLAEHIAAEAERTISFAGPQNLSVMLEGVVREHVLYAQIVQTRAFVGAEEVPVRPSLVLAEKKQSALELPPEGARELERGRLSDGTPYLDLKRPWRLGYVRLGVSLEYIADEVRLDLLIVSSVSAGLVLLGTLVAFWLYRSILQPLEQLAASVRAFGQGDFRARVTVRTHQEIEALAREFNRMADSIVQMKEELERSSRAKSEFLTIMGHELRTPLNALLGHAQLLGEELEGTLNPAQRERLAALLRSGEHLLELLESVLRFAKLEMGQERLVLQPCEVNAVIAEALSSVQALAVQKGIELRFQPVSPLIIQADRTKLRQILINLLTNGIKYTEQGFVEVCVERSHGAVRFAVRDSGRGIAPEAQARLFEPFTQLSPSEGLGLGLAIVKRYVEMHGGRVWVESQVGQGSTFYFTIPYEDLNR
uniref:histidine kinase n=1 Tax=Acetithermum autotrophicum TaxID=1446466 RepID=H5SQM2_ACEAU|nr:signal transduction histidine kinase [Candidatus Acetothermum autotrophicum]